MFYPAHDLALANGVRHYTPPAFVRRMQDDLADLAKWWTGPWGWNYDTRAALLRQGMSPEALPTDGELVELRRLSSRERTVEIMETMSDLCPSVAVPRCLVDVGDLVDTLVEVAQMPCALVLKAPWSSSGRGQMRYLPSGNAERDGLALEKLHHFGEAVIRRMGSVMAEPWYAEKRRDFAMLFRIGSDSVAWEGYSLFENDAQGTYRAGLLASDTRIEDLLCADSGHAEAATRRLLAAIRCRYEKDLLPRLFAALMHRPWEVGYVGIDMMTISTPACSGGLEASDVSQIDEWQSPLIIHPCVEMNVRCTMGIVARHIFDRGATARKEGMLRIITRPDGHFSAEIDMESSTDLYDTSKSLNCLK